jgi:electron transfer flavoprotein beta subunit
VPVNILVCVKRVPATGGRIVLTPDGSDIDVRYLGFTVSPHEECAVEEAVRIVEAQGGSSVVLTLGPAAAEEQLRDAMAIGIDRAILLETDGRDWDPVATSGAIVEAIRAQEASGGPFDLILFGNESADSGGFQVGIRTAHALGRPCATGLKALQLNGTKAVARREAAGGGWESFELPLPAVVTVKEGINLPRYPSVPGRLRARKKEIERSTPTWQSGGMEKIVLRLPQAEVTAAEVIGRGPDAAPAVVDLLAKIGVLRG